MPAYCRRALVGAKLAFNAGLFSLSAFVTSSVPALAQSDCDVGPLSRDGRTQHRLAIRVDGEWKKFSQNSNGPAHVLDSERLAPSLCLAWEAPRYRALGRQVVYASTRFTEQEHMSLYRRGFALGEDREVLGGHPDSDLDRLIAAFRAYHSGSDSDLQELLDDWHQRAASFDLVQGAVLVSADLPYGSERLITLLPWRLRKSWVPIEATRLEGGTLRVAVAYSVHGGAVPPTYVYTFAIR